MEEDPPSILDEQPYEALLGVEKTRNDPSPTRRASVANRRRSLIDTPFFEVDEATELILRANAPPKAMNGALQEILNNIRATRYSHEQFAKIQAQTGMNPTTLRFSPDYEIGYHRYLQRASVSRTRICLLLGFVATFLYFLWDSQRVTYTALTFFIAFGLGVSSFGFGLLLTFIPYFQMLTETITFSVFSCIALVLIALKPLHAERGPILPLLILIIPIFGVTRMRFLYCTILGWVIVATYIIVQLSCMNSLGSNWDTRSDIFYQSINYGIALISGMVSNYRQELLRRRNYALKLPFAGMSERDCSNELQKEKFSKRRLMTGWTMEFNNAEVENCFIRHWYLIDPFPFENPNAAVLHQGAFRVIRFSVMTALLNQCFLAIQDYRLLHSFPKLAEFGYILRFGVVAVAYMSAALFMFIMGKRYYKTWLSTTASLPNHSISKDEGASNESSYATDEGPSANSDRPWCSIKQQGPYSLVGTEDEEDTKVAIPSIAKTVRNWRILTRLLHSESSFEINERMQSNDARSAQMYAIAVVGLHTTCMAVMLFFVALTNGSQSFSDIYLMGFLNAMVFAHRSGFRVRHKYAFEITAFVSIATIIVAIVLLHPEDDINIWFRYGVYILVVLVLGAMISREEESLRRTFFILKSIRSLEFDEWYQRVTKVQGWIRARLHQKCMAVRAKREPTKRKKEKKILVNTGAYLAQASKMGVYGELLNIMLVLIDIAMKMK